jgi:hypothetical protein
MKVIVTAVIKEARFIFPVFGRDGILVAGVLKARGNEVSADPHPGLTRIYP